MSTESTIRLRVARRFRAPAERVFDAWLDAEWARRWLFATPAGEIVRAELDPRVGGRYLFVDRRYGEDVEHAGEYLEIDRPRRLVFTFGLPRESPDFDRVTVEIVPVEDGCELTLTHDMDARWAEHRGRAEEGWAALLEGLERALRESGATAERAQGGHGVLLGTDGIRFERRLAGPIERVWAYLTDSEKRARWLASGAVESRVGGRVEHLFRNAALTPHEDRPPEKYANLEPEVRMDEGRVTAWEPPNLLAYTWPSEGGGPGEVRFELSPDGDGVLLVLTHRGLGSRDQRVGVAGGWHTHLDILVDVLDGRVPAEGFWARHTRLESEYGERIGASA